MATTGQRAQARTAVQTTGVIGSWRCTTSKRSRSRTRLIRGIAAGLRMMFGSAPFAGTITERPIGITLPVAGRAARAWDGARA